MLLTGFDTETDRIGPGNVVPNIVCASFAQRQGDGWFKDVVGDGDGFLDETIDGLLDDPNVYIVCHNAPYDLAVICRDKPHRYTKVFKLLWDGRVYDTATREKMLNLATTGKISMRQLPSGVWQKVEYGLAPLIKHHFGRDRTDEKKLNDAWRTNYNVFHGVPTSQWPQEARDYAIDDSSDAVELWEHQEERNKRLIEQRGIDAFQTQTLRVAADFCLMLMTARGIAVHKENKAQFEAEIAKELTHEHLDLLIKEKILRPAEPPRPVKRAKPAADGTVKMTKGTKETRDMARLRAYMLDCAARFPEIEIRYSDPSDKFPEGQISTEMEWFDEYYHLDPVLEQYRHRQKLQKFVTTELPRMNWYDDSGIEDDDHRTVTADIVHPAFDILKETGRTSSYAAKLYPSANGQNVDARARKCYKARDGLVLFSRDYNGMELGTTAQRCYERLGYSVMREKINKGVDLHEYLGAQLAFRLEPDFRAICDAQGISEYDDVHQVFKALKKCGEPELEKMYKHFRKFAKPTGLGYPGGLGPPTFITYAKGTFGVTVDLETAKELREIWREVFPEVPEYHRKISRLSIDKYNSGRRKNKDTGESEEYEKYCYTTPLGLHRAGCDYCSWANGDLMQSPSAEGAEIGLFLVTRACYDPSQSSILYGTTWPTIFIHDEIVGEMVDDDRKTERDEEIGRLMVEGMELVTPDVKAGSTGALMRVWDKNAEPVFDDAGKLQVWEPKTPDKKG